MTTEAYTNPAPILISGTGPYPYNRPYMATSDLSLVILLNGSRTVLDTAAWSISPAASETGGNITLTDTIATTFIGGTLYVLRDTDLEQGWVGLLGTREKGLEVALDRITRGAQDVRSRLTSTIRIDGTISPIIATPNGFLKWNLDGTGIEAVDAPSLPNAISFATRHVQSFIGNGVTTSFTLSENPSSLANLTVILNGLTLTPSIDYAWTGGTSLVLTTAPADGDRLVVWWGEVPPVLGDWAAAAEAAELAADHAAASEQAAALDAAAAAASAIDSAAAVDVLEPRVVSLETSRTLGYIPVQDVVAAATGNVALTGAYTVDGRTMSNGDRYLAPAQTDPTQCGIYVYNSTGAHVRATDMDAPGEFAGRATFVEGGNTLIGTTWQCTSTVTTLGTDPVTFAKITSQGPLQALAHLDAITQARSAVSAARVSTDTVNLFDQTRAALNYAISNTNGALVPSASFYAIQGVQVSPGVQIVLSQNSGVVTWHDQAGVYLSTYAGVAYAGVPLTPPAGAYLMNAQFYGLANAAALMIVPGTVVPSSYVPYGLASVGSADIAAMSRARAAAQTSRSDDANVCDPSDVSDQRGLTITQGTLYALAGYQVSGLTEVNPGDYYAMSQGSGANNYYDRNGAVMGAPGVICSFVGWLDGAGTLTVTSVYWGTLAVGDVLSSGEQITGLGSGTGKTGTYTVTGSTARASADRYTAPTFTGSINGNILTVTAVPGQSYITRGPRISGAGVAAGTCILHQISGTDGGPGTYWVSIPQTVASTQMQVTNVLSANTWVQVPAGAYYLRARGSGTVLTAGQMAIRQGKAAYVGGAKFTGTISGTELTASGVTGTIRVGDYLYGAASAVQIIGPGTGTGGAGTYTLASAPGDVTGVAMRTAPSSLVSVKPFGGGGAVYPRAGARIGYIGNSQTNSLSYQVELERVTGLTRVFSDGNPGGDLNTMLTRIGALTASIQSVDILVLQEGHNEWGGAARPLGSITDAAGTGSTYAILKACLNAIYAANPSVLIVLMGPTYRGPCTISGITYTADTTANAQGVTGAQIDDAFRAVCQLPDYAIPYPELRRTSQINVTTVMTWTNEGLHWSNAGGGPRIGRITAAAINAGM